MELGCQHRQILQCVCAVSYTHLDVYKRQILFFHSTTLRAMEIQRQFTDKVILYTRDKELKKVPLIIPDREMNIFMLVTSSGEKGMEYLGADSTKFCRGERVRVIDGKFKGAEGYICRIKKNSRLVVAIPVSYTHLYVRERWRTLAGDGRRWYQYI